MFISPVLDHLNICEGNVNQSARPVPAGEVFSSNCVKYVNMVTPLDPQSSVLVLLNWFDEDLFSDRSVIQYKFTLIAAVSRTFCKIWLALIRTFSHTALWARWSIFGLELINVIVLTPRWLPIFFQNCQILIFLFCSNMVVWWLYRIQQKNWYNLTHRIK